jgi:hypothetical protein
VREALHEGPQLRGRQRPVEPAVALGLGAVDDHHAAVRIGLERGAPAHQIAHELGVEQVDRG